MYRPDGDLTAPEGSPNGALSADESHHLAALVTQAAPGSWRRDAVAGDFYAAKGLVEAVGAAARLELAFAAPKDAPPFLHPGRSAVVHAGVVELGWIGELHPLIARAWDLEGGAAFELDFDAMAAATPQVEQFADVTSFPAVRQDIAVVAPAEVEAAAIRAVVLEAGGELLAGAEVFDVYEGEQVGRATARWPCGWSSARLTGR